MVQPQFPRTATPTTIREVGIASIVAEGTANTNASTKKAPNIYGTNWLQLQKHQEGSMSDIVRALEIGEAIGVSDGSYSEKNGKGAAAWIITNPNKTTYVTASAISPGVNKIQSAYRSELIGILALLEELKAICNHWNIKKGRCSIFCDELLALKRVDELDELNLSSKSN